MLKNFIFHHNDTWMIVGLIWSFFAMTYWSFASTFLHKIISYVLILVSLMFGLGFIQYNSLYHKTIKEGSKALNLKMVYNEFSKTAYISASSRDNVRIVKNKDGEEIEESDYLGYFKIHCEGQDKTLNVEECWNKHSNLSYLELSKDKQLMHDSSGSSFIFFRL